MILFKGGIPVVVPRAERYAVHKLIVGVERDNAASDKDIKQASELILALSTKRPLELAEAWDTAWEAGSRWREKLEEGRARLKSEISEALDDVAERARRSTERRE